ncbi:MAG: hypothetical protein HOE90_18895 [Bacteriovoracaceae bacterium]|jgi:hypothetical protein|nr:hypothetical protein [Bacteriovoracaceae bacterium]
MHKLFILSLVILLSNSLYSSSFPLESFVCGYGKAIDGELQEFKFDVGKSETVVTIIDNITQEQEDGRVIYASNKSFTVNFKNRDCTRAPESKFLIYCMSDGNDDSSLQVLTVGLIPVGATSHLEIEVTNETNSFGIEEKTVKKMEFFSGTCK